VPIGQRIADVPEDRTGRVLVYLCVARDGELHWTTPVHAVRPALAQEFQSAACARASFAVVAAGQIVVVPIKATVTQVGPPPQVSTVLPHERPGP
jgi:hypothetical protein